MCKFNQSGLLALFPIFFKNVLLFSNIRAIRASVFMICATSVDKILNYDLTCPSAQRGTGELRVQRLTLLCISSFPNCLSRIRNRESQCNKSGSNPTPPPTPMETGSPVSGSPVSGIFPYQGQVREVGKG
jgi:hypothetical protein